MSKCVYDYSGARALLKASRALDEFGNKADVSSVDLYSIVRYMIEEMIDYDEFISLAQDALKDGMEEDHIEALTMNEMIAKDPTIKDEWDDFDAMLDQQDLGDVDPSTYQVQEDDGCEGGACKI